MVYSAILATVAAWEPSGLYADGTDIHMLLIVMLLLLFGTVLVYTLLLWRKNRTLKAEILHREQVQLELTEAKNRYQTLVDNLPQSIFWKDAGSRYISVNKTYAQLMGHRTSDMTGKTDHDFFPRHIADKFRADDKRIMASGESEELVDQLAFSGKPRWIHTVKTPLFDEQKGVRGILGIFWDVTDQKKAHDDLRETQRFNESVMRSTLDVVYIYDVETDAVVYTNPHLSELLGYGDAEVRAMGSIFHERLLHPDDQWVISDLVARSDGHREGTIESIEMRVRDTVGRWRWFQARYAVFKRNAAGRVCQIIGTLHDITERVTVENALRMAFDRAQRYLDIVETIIVALDREGRITLINRKGSQVLGGDAAELAGKNWFETCLPPEDRTETAQFFGMMITGDAGAIEYHENSIVSAEGERRIIAWHNSLLRDENGHIIGTLSAGQDITERKTAEELFKSEKLRQGMLLELSQFSGLTVAQTMDYALDTALVLTKSPVGYLCLYDEENGRFAPDCWSKEVMDNGVITEPQIMHELEETGLRGETVRQRKPTITNNDAGGKRWKKGGSRGGVDLVRNVNVPVFDDGKIVAVIGVGNKTDPYGEADVRHLQLLMDSVWKVKKRIEMELQVRQLNEDLEQKIRERTAEVRSAHEVLDRFFTLTLDLLCIADVDGTFIRCNKAWEVTLGYSVNDLEGKRFLDFVHPEDAAGTLKQVGLLRDGGEVVDFVNRYRCSDGSYRWIEWRSNTAGTLIYAAARDITGQKEYEDKLIKAKEEADRANQAKSRFLATISHEIRTPLNAVIGYSDLLSGMSTGKKERVYSDSISLAGRNLLRLINDILDLSKIEADMMAINYGAVNLTALLDEIEQIFSFQLSEKHLAFSMQIDGRLPRYLVLDEVRIRQVLLNLMGNAVKFTASGHIRIMVSCSDSAAGLSKIDLSITVEDTGIGIDREQYDEIFEAFRQQQSSQHGGTGLGLSICKKLLALMNGSISVESVPGEGSRFTVLLPELAVASIAPSEGEMQWCEVAEGVSAGARSVLVVDDIPSNREMLATLLTEAGLTVYLAHDGQAAVNRARTDHPACIIMDLLMPVLDGVAAAKILRNSPETAAIPIIALTTLAEELQDDDNGGGLFNGRLCKPVSADDLFEELAKHLPGMQHVQLLSEETSGIFAGTGKEGYLPQEFYGKAGELLGAVKMEDIRTFAQQIVAFGKERRLPQLWAIGKRLADHADHFDISAVRSILRKIAEYQAV
jgi:PAS domain S-box-containing protein